MLRRVILSLVVAVVVILGGILLGSVLALINVPIAGTVGGFLKTYSTAFGVLAGLWYFFRGSVAV